MKQTLLLLTGLAVLPSLLHAAGAPDPKRAPIDRVVVKIRDHRGQPVPGASVLTLESSASRYMRQGIIWADSNGVAVAEVGKDAYVGIRVSAPGFQPWLLEMEPGVAERRGKVIEVRLVKRTSKGSLIPVSL